MTDVFDAQKSFTKKTFITQEKFNMNPGEKQAEIYTYEAPWLIYACNWSVRLRFFCLYVYIALYVALFLSLALCVYDAMEFQSGAALYSLWNGIQIISTRCCLLYTLYVRSFSRISTDTNLLFLSLSFVMINVINT